jgi:predicted amidohydrolase
MKAAIYQLDIVFGKKESNLQKSRKKIEEAAKEEIDLLVLPELFSTGFAYHDFDNLFEVADSSPTLNRLTKWSQEWHIGLAGSVLLKPKQKDRYHNIGFIISPSKGLEYIYPKIHLWGSEKNYFLAGREVPQPIDFENKAIIGLAICYDLRFPEIYRFLATKGADILITTAAWPEARIEHFTLLARARALENTCYHIAANKTGMDLEPLNTKYNGNSKIINPFGQSMVALGSEEAIISAELTPKLLEKARDRIPVLKDRKLF